MNQIRKQKSEAQVGMRHPVAKLEGTLPQELRSAWEKIAPDLQLSANIQETKIGEGEEQWKVTLGV